MAQVSLIKITLIGLLSDAGIESECGYKSNKNKGAKLKSNVKNWCCVFRINKQQIIFMLGRDAKNLRTNLNANLVSLRPIIDFDKCVGEVSAKLHLYCYK